LEPRFTLKFLEPLQPGKRTLTVLPFPEAGKPTNFNGAVGDFSFEVKASKDALNASESLKQQVEVKGKVT
jgi:hypothetical protein